MVEQFGFYGFILKHKESVNTIKIESLKILFLIEEYIVYVFYKIMLTKMCKYHEKVRKNILLIMRKCVFVFD